MVAATLTTLSGGFSWIVWGVISALALGLIVWLYGYERRLVSRRAGRALMVIRLVAALVLLVLLLGPVIEWAETYPSRGKLIFGVDVSNSMSVPDGGRTQAEVLRLGAALGRTPKGVTRQQMLEWADKLDARSASAAAKGKGEPNDKTASKGQATKTPADAPTKSKAAPKAKVAKAPGAKAPGAKAKGAKGSAKAPTASKGKATKTAKAAKRSTESKDELAHTAALVPVIPSDKSAEVTSLCDELAKLTRADVLRRLLNQDDDPLLARLDRQHEPVWLTVAKTATDVVRDQLGQTAKPKGDPLQHKYTDLSQVLARAVREARQGRIVGVVLASDGRHNHGRNPIDLARQLADLSVPVFGVLVGSHRSPPDVAVVRADCPGDVYVGDTAVIRAEVLAHGLDAPRVAVHLRYQGKDVETKTLTLKPNQQRYDVEFTVPVKEKGTRRYEVVADRLPNEFYPDNNARQAVVRVAEDKSRVLIIEGAARWEFRYLFNALTRDPRVDVKAVVFDRPSAGLMKEGTYLDRLPERRQDLEAYDVIILGDVPPKHLSPDAIENIVDFVSERAGALVMMPGRHYLPRAYTDRRLWGLVPVVLSETESAEPGPAGLALALTPDGQRSPLMRLSDVSDRNLAVWQGLPRVYWALAGRPKPGATALAHCVTAPDAAGADTHAVVVMQPYGLGEVFWCGTDETWRWRLKVADKYFHRFWGQVVRWATSRRLTAGNDVARFGPRRPVYQEGEPIVVQARVSPDYHPKLGEPMMAMRFLQGDREAARVRLRRVRPDSLTYQGPASRLPAGTYTLKLFAPELAGKTDTLETTVEVHAPESDEDVYVSANRDLMQKLASQTGGRLFTPDTIAELPDALAQRRWNITVHKELALWTGWLPLAVFLSLVTLEWIVRKWVGLP